MCGFSFAISKNKIEKKNIIKMNRLISHRGPDSENFVNSNNYKINGNFNFIGGFRRLKIIDLSKKADQPMVFKNKYIIFFNGEIYNYLELKSFLKKKYKFISNSDTEVILAAYDHWGVKCFNKFNGMWSMLIFDLTKNKLIACRDRYGVKPLYFRKIKDTYYFGSEIKQLLFLEKNNNINKEKLYNFLEDDLLSYDHETLINGIYQVKPGCYLDLDPIKFSFKEKKWYIFNRKIINNKISKKKISYILKNSIELRLRSDVKLGISLSGGIDSSTIASIIANLDNKLINKIYTFSSRSRDKNDENEYVKEFCKLYSFKNIPVDLKFTNFKKSFLKIVKQHDNPISNLSIFSEWEIFKKMKSKDIKVNIDGHGADEQLCGYENYFSLYLLECLKRGEIFLFFKFYIDLFKSNTRNKFYFIIKVALNLLPDRYLNLLKNITNQKIKKKWIKINYKNYKKPSFDKNLVINQNFIQFFKTSLPKQLNWSDINSMSHSVETRSPFLDFNFVESVLPLTMKQKLRGIKSKYILRETFKNIIPKKIYERNFKVGFMAPGEKWTKNNRSYIEKLFKYYFSYVTQILNTDCSNQAIKIIRGQSKYRDWIWKIIFLGAWIKHHNVKI